MTMLVQERNVDLATVCPCRIQMMNADPNRAARGGMGIAIEQSLVHEDERVMYQLRRRQQE